MDTSAHECRLLTAIDILNFMGIFRFRCVGQAASMGSLLLAAGAPGMRHSLPNSRIMIHQPSGGAHVIVVFRFI